MIDKYRTSLIGLVGALLGSLAGWIVVSNLVVAVADLSWLEKGFLTCSVGVLASGFSVWFDTALNLGKAVRENTQRLDHLTTEVQKINKYSKASQFVGGQKSGPPRQMLEKGLQEVQSRIEYIHEGEVPIERNKVLEWWEDLVSSSNHTVITTNFVKPSDWSDVARDRAGKQTQVQAIESGVSICRVNILNYGNCPDFRDKSEYNDLKRRHQEAGAIVKEMDYELIDEINMLHRIADELARDLMLIDKSIVLKTKISWSCDLKRAFLSVREDDVSRAIKFFDRIIHYCFDIESDYVPEGSGYESKGGLKPKEKEFLNSWYNNSN